MLVNVILGTEKLDSIESKADFKKMLFSSHMKIPIIGIIDTGIYILILSVFAYISLNYDMPSETFGQIWASILLASSIPITLIYVKMAKKRIMFEFPWKNISKYVASSIVMAGFLLFISEFLSYNPKITLFLPQLLLVVFSGIVIYLGILILIDKESMELAKKTFLLIKK